MSIDVGKWSDGKSLTCVVEPHQFKAALAGKISCPDFGVLCPAGGDAAIRTLEFVYNNFIKKKLQKGQKMLSKDLKFFKKRILSQNCKNCKNFVKRRHIVCQTIYKSCFAASKKKCCYGPT
jgi:hypothetical protein